MPGLLSEVQHYTPYNQFSIPPTNSNTNNKAYKNK